MPTVLRKTQVKSKITKGGKREPVGEAEYAEFGSLADAINGVPAMNIAGLGEAEVLRLVNVQNKTNAMNAIRANATQKPTKQSWIIKAFQTIPAEKLAELQGDEAKMTAFVKSEAERLEKEYEENRASQLRAAGAAAVEGGADDTDDDDDDDDNDETVQ